MRPSNCVTLSHSFRKERGMDGARSCQYLERFSNRYSPCETVQGGFFLRKKPLNCGGFGVQQLENRYSGRSNWRHGRRQYSQPGGQRYILSSIDE
jgi:hypothetical protein